jgi:glycosyltransferase involved in cell wall biosynthesis
MGESNMSEAKIAAILCNHNDSRFLISVVERIARQDPDEFIIVNDRSTDGSGVLLSALQRHYGFKIVENDGVHSPFGSFVKGCQSTDADFVACFSADDYPNDDYLMKMRAAISAFPIVDVYTCNTDVIREGDVYKRTLLPFTAYISPEYAVKIFRAGYAKNINQCGIVIKRDWVLRCWEGGGKKTQACFDCMYSFSSIFRKGFINLGDYLTTYRSYPNGFGAASSNRKIKEASRMHKRFYRRNSVYEYGAQSGIWSAKARWKAIVAIWGIMKLPKWARIKFYKWFYSYDMGVEKL